MTNKIIYQVIRILQKKKAAKRKQWEEAMGRPEEAMGKQ
jgi:hypothetical protein